MENLIKNSQGTMYIFSIREEKSLSLHLVESQPLNLGAV